MALSEDELRLLGRLNGSLQAARKDQRYPGGQRLLGLDSLDAYYNGVQRLNQLGLAVPDELRRFITIVNWPRLVIDALEERLDVEGFRPDDEAGSDEELWRIWQANDLDEESQLGHLDALVLARSFVTVGTNEDDEDTPLITVESPLEMFADIDPRTRRIAAALKIYDKPGDLVRLPTTEGALYLPNQTIYFSKGRNGFQEDDRDQHDIGQVPVQQLTNRGRTKGRHGVSEMLDVIPLTDAAARALTNAQVATELLATPQRWVVGTAKGDFVDEAGEPIPAWETYLGRIWSTENEGAKMGQFSAADLRNFEVVVDLYAKHVAGISGTPLRYFGENTANPPSAEGIRADEARLVKRAERRQRAWGGTWERVMRMARRFVEGAFDPNLAQMETLWRDAATPTRAQATDAVVKLWATGRYPTEAGLRDLGKSATEVRELMDQLKSEADDPLTALLNQNNQPPAAPPTDQPVTDGATAVG